MTAETSGIDRDPMWHRAEPGDVLGLPASCWPRTVEVTEPPAR